MAFKSPRIITFIAFPDYAGTMVDGEAAPDYVLKINQVKDNLKTWNPYEWVTFWVAIPALLFAIRKAGENRVESQKIGTQSDL